MHCNKMVDENQFLNSMMTKDITFLGIMLITPLQVALYTTRTPHATTPVMSDTLSDPVVTGILCYATGLTLLTIWETYVVPTMNLNSILPKAPLKKGQFTKEEREIAWITPELCAFSPPHKADLLSRGKYVVGCRDDVRQIITLEKRKLCRGVCDVSEQWSDYYGDDIFIFKERVL